MLLQPASGLDALAVSKKVFVMIEEPHSGVPQAVAVVVDQGAAGGGDDGR